MNYNYTMATTVTPVVFENYINKKKVELHIDGAIINGLSITVATIQDLTPTEQTALYDYVMAYTDFDLSIVNCDILEQAKKFSNDLMHEYSVMNMQKKHEGLLTSIDLYNQLKELSDAYIMQALMSGSLEVVLMMIDGVIIDGNVLVPKFIPNHVPQEDVDMIKSRILEFVSSL